MASFRCWLQVAVGLAWALPASGEPVDLRDRTPRLIAVQIEISPPDQPGRLNSVYTERLQAHLAPHPNPEWVVVTLPAALVESHIMVRENPKEGSFADFVWILDVSSGHVISAELDGTVLRRIQFGPLHRTVEARIRASMSTVRSAGFRAQRQLLGQRVFDLCDADDGDCTLVSPVPYDPRTGYVNAVGVISARTRGAGADNFSSLGEARFSELHTESAPAVASGPATEPAAEQP
jgi:hypothetical protein